MVWVGNLFVRFPLLSAVVCAVCIVLFGYIGFFDPTASADDLVFFRIMTGVCAVGLVFFGRQARFRSEERREPVTDLTDWSPRLEGGEPQQPLAADASSFVVSAKDSNGNQLHTVVLADRLRFWMWQGGTRRAQDIIGSIKLGWLPSPEVSKPKPMLDIDRVRLQSIMHRPLSSKLNVEHFDEAGGSRITSVGLNEGDAAAGVVARLEQEWGWHLETIPSPSALRWRDVRSNLWVPLAASVLVWHYGERWLGQPADIIAAVACAAVGVAALSLIVGRKTERVRLTPTAR